MPKHDAPVGGRELIMQPHPVEVLSALVRDAKRTVDQVQRELDEAKASYAQAHAEYRQYVSKLAGIPL